MGKRKNSAHCYQNLVHLISAECMIDPFKHILIHIISLFLKSSINGIVKVQTQKIVLILEKKTLDHRFHNHLQVAKQDDQLISQCILIQTISMSKCILNQTTG